MPYMSTYTPHIQNTVAHIQEQQFPTLHLQPNTQEEITQCVKASTPPGRRLSENAILVSDIIHAICYVGRSTDYLCTH